MKWPELKFTRTQAISAVQLFRRVNAWGLVVHFSTILPEIPFAKLPDLAAWGDQWHRRETKLFSFRIALEEFDRVSPRKPVSMLNESAKPKMPSDHKSAINRAHLTNTEPKRRILLKVEHRKRSQGMCDATKRRSLFLLLLVCLRVLTTFFAASLPSLRLFWRLPWLPGRVVTFARLYWFNRVVFQSGSMPLRILDGGYGVTHAPPDPPPGSGGNLFRVGMVS